jgi:hypothetical protein
LQVIPAPSDHRAIHLAHFDPHGHVERNVKHLPKVVLLDLRGVLREQLPKGFVEIVPDLAGFRAEGRMDYLAR